MEKHKSPFRMCLQRQRHFSSSFPTLLELVVRYARGNDKDELWESLCEWDVEKFVEASFSSGLSSFSPPLLCRLTCLRRQIGSFCLTSEECLLALDDGRRMYHCLSGYQSSRSYLKGKNKHIIYVILHKQM